MRSAVDQASDDEKLGLINAHPDLVGRLAREDQNIRVRRYALTLLRGVAELAQQAKARAAATGQKAG